MDLTPGENTKLETYIIKNNIPTKYQARIKQILKMTLDECTINEIKAEVGGAKEIITETRMKARRRGVV